MTAGRDITRWAQLSREETCEVIFHAWFCRAQLDEAEKRQRAGDRFALLTLPAYCRPDERAGEKFQNYFFKIKPQQTGENE